MANEVLRPGVSAEFGLDDVQVIVAGTRIHVTDWLFPGVNPSLKMVVLSGEFITTTPLLPGTEMSVEGPLFGPGSEYVRAPMALVKSGKETKPSSKSYVIQWEASGRFETFATPIPTVTTEGAALKASFLAGDPLPDDLALILKDALSPKFDWDAAAKLWRDREK